MKTEEIVDTYTLGFLECTLCTEDYNW